MTVYVFADPLRTAIDYLDGKKANYPASTTVDDSFPTALSAPHVQVAWDGTPSQRQQDEQAAIRVTVWAPKGKGTDARALASTVRRDLLLINSTATWGASPGAGRAYGVDPDTGLPFCTFTVNVDIRPL